MTEGPAPEVCCDRSTRTFIDESFHSGETGPGTYLFAAVSLNVSEQESVRQRLRAALPGKLSRFHWRVDSSETRAVATAVLAGLPIKGIVIVQLLVPARQQERFRQHGLWNLVVELKERCCHDLVFEARESAQNKRDQDTLSSIVRSGVAGDRFTYTFGRPLDEPLLWLPDTLVGVYASNHHHGDAQYWNTLEQHPEVVEIPPPKR